MLFEMTDAQTPSFWGRVRWRNAERACLLLSSSLGLRENEGKQVSKRGAEQCRNTCKREQRKMNKKSARCVNWPGATTRLPMGSFMPKWWWKLLVSLNTLPLIPQAIRRSLAGRMQVNEEELASVLHNLRVFARNIRFSYNNVILWIAPDAQHRPVQRICPHLASNIAT